MYNSTNTNKLSVLPGTLEVVSSPTPFIAPAEKSYTFKSNVVERGFEPDSSQIEDYHDYNIGICCFFTKHKALRSMKKDQLTLNQDNMS